MPTPCALRDHPQAASPDHTREARSDRAAPPSRAPRQSSALRLARAALLFDESEMPIPAAPRCDARSLVGAYKGSCPDYRSDEPINSHVLTSGDASRHLSMSVVFHRARPTPKHETPSANPLNFRDHDECFLVAHGTLPDLSGYCARTFPLMPVGYTSQRSVQVSGITDIGLLTPLRHLDPLPVRQASVLPSASSGFAVTRDTVAVRLTLLLAECIEDFHLQVHAPCRAHR